MLALHRRSSIDEHAKTKLGDWGGRGGGKDGGVGLTLAASKRQISDREKTILQPLKQASLRPIDEGVTLVPASF